MAARENVGSQGESLQGRNGRGDKFGGVRTKKVVGKIENQNRPLNAPEGVAEDLEGQDLSRG